MELWAVTTLFSMRPIRVRRRSTAAATARTTARWRVSPASMTTFTSFPAISYRRCHEIYSSSTASTDPSPKLTVEAEHSRGRFVVARVATKTIWTSRMECIIWDRENLPDTVSANLGARYQVDEAHSALRADEQSSRQALLDRLRNWEPRRSITTTIFVARPFGTPYGDDDDGMPIRSSSFQAPGTPSTFMEG